MDKNAFLKLVEEKFRSADKALAGTLMAELTTIKFDGSKSMHQHVLDMTNTAARLKTLGVDKKLKPKAKNFKKKQHATTLKVSNGEKKEQHNNKCNFCRKEGHFQMDCPKHKTWSEKKGIHYVVVCFESNLSKFPSTTWWFDSGATTPFQYYVGIPYNPNHKSN
ncbi:retrovirus-related pol polyprotein from transposon TNT 1-94 [Tanacetum coccineum]